MTGSLDIERVLDAWLGEGPDIVADRVIDGALAEIDHIEQRPALGGLPRRDRHMTTILRLAALAAAIAALGAGAWLLGGGSATPAPSPSLGTQAWPTFTSMRHGYQMQYPVGWTATPATEPWLAAGSDVGVAADASFDRFQSSDPSIAFSVTSQAVPAGMSEDDWLAAYEKPAQEEWKNTSWGPSCWPPPADWKAIEIDGLPARMHGGIPKCLFTEAVVFRGGRAYLFTGTHDTFDGFFDRATFDSILATVVLAPDRADDTPGASPSPSPSPA